MEFIGDSDDHWEVYPTSCRVTGTAQTNNLEHFDVRASDWGEGLLPDEDSPATSIEVCSSQVKVRWRRHWQKKVYDDMKSLCSAGYSVGKERKMWEVGEDQQLDRSSADDVFQNTRKSRMLIPEF